MKPRAVVGTNDLTELEYDRFFPLVDVIHRRGTHRDYDHRQNDPHQILAAHCVRLLRRLERSCRVLLLVSAKAPPKPVSPDVPSNWVIGALELR